MMKSRALSRFTQVNIHVEKTNRSTTLLGPVKAIRIADNCQYFLSVGQERSVKVYDFERNDLIYELPFFHGGN